jgi:hypothetical protein
LHLSHGIEFSVEMGMDLLARAGPAAREVLREEAKRGGGAGFGVAVSAVRVKR